MTPPQDTRQPNVPTELHDHSDGASPIVAVRIDGPQSTRGRAAAFFAREWDLDFRRVRVRKKYFRLDPDYIAEQIADGIEEPYDGWTWFECDKDAEGAQPFWELAGECRP